MKKTTATIRSFAAMLLCLVMIAGLAACGKKESAQEPAPSPAPDNVPEVIEPAKLEGNLLKITTEADFEAGAEKNDIQIVGDIGDGAIMLAEGATEGTFISAEYNTEDFYRMVACWNAAIYDGGSVEIWAKAYTNGAWTDWLTWGEFSPFDQNRGTSQNKKTDGAKVDVDIFICTKATASKVQMKAVLRRDSAQVKSPVLRAMTMTFDGGNMVATYAEEPLATLPDKVYNAAPAYSQGVRHPAVSGSICSPTTMTVMMNSRVPELDLLPEEYALNIRDVGSNMFGNWAFTVAGAGLYGFEAYCQYADVNILLQELAKGHSVGLSVAYSPKTGDGYNKLDGSYGPTGGHLITLIGYDYEGEVNEDNLYFYSSDSYSADDTTSYHRYSWPQLKRCWERRLAYIIPSMEQEVTGELAQGVIRVESEMVKTADGNWMPKPKDGSEFDAARFKNSNSLVGYTVEGVFKDMSGGGEATNASVVYENPMQVTANNKFAYDIVNEDGSVKLDPAAAYEKFEVEGGTITVYFFTDYGYCYIGTIN